MIGVASEGLCCVGKDGSAPVTHPPSTITNFARMPILLFAALARPILRQLITSPFLVRRGSRPFDKPVRFARHCRQFCYSASQALPQTGVRCDGRFDMSRTKTLTANSNVRRRSKPTVGSDGKNSDIEFSLVEIVRALARSAAREDHRKAIEAEAMSPAKAKQ